MGYTLSSALYVLILFVGMLALGEVGRRLAHRRAARDPEGTWHGVGVVDGAIFALLGLIVAFTFSGAVSRFDVRRNLVVEEANAIGTAYLRLDLLPADSRAALRESFRRYVESRIRSYRLLPDIEAAKAELAKSKMLQQEIWSRALAASRSSQSATMLVVPSLNQMFDIAATRTTSTLFHPPVIVFALLFALALLASVLVGYEMAKARSRGWLHTIVFAAVAALAVYVILDLEFPRLGLIRVSAIDQALVELRESMN
jgi:hypothetical protein